jgi:membrane-bound metal-dependent hydrolase YbcI (DUF457 family)
MDPLAHTLAGAAIAEAGLRRATPLATATLILGANAPDIDAITYFIGADVALGFRRGWTHGVLAMVVLPLVLTALMLAIDRLLLRSPGRPPARPLPLLGVALLAVLSHPALDWLNTYGVRLLMPFDGRWFYGDSVFIVDVYLWLMFGAGVALARSRGRAGILTWVVAATATLGFVFLSDRAPAAAKVLFCAGVLAIVALRVRDVPKASFEGTSQILLGCAAIYILSMIAASQAAKAQARSILAARGVEVTDLVASPAAGDRGAGRGRIPPAGAGLAARPVRPARDHLRPHQHPDRDHRGCPPRPRGGGPGHLAALPCVSGRTCRGALPGAHRRRPAHRPRRGSHARHGGGRSALSAEVDPQRDPPAPIGAAARRGALDHLESSASARAILKLIVPSAGSTPEPGGRGRRSPRRCRCRG